MSTTPGPYGATHGERPRVSIGLPVYNGEAFVAEAIDSILAQSFTDFELIISDNASTDGTRDICAARAARDLRIRYVRNPENVGATRNFNHVVAMARGPYFKWAAHDDLHEIGYLAACVAALDADPALSLVYPRMRDIDETGHVIAERRFQLACDHMDPVVRFRDLIRLDFTCEPIFGLMRTSSLRRTGLLSNYADCDRVLLAEIGLSGRMHELPEVLFIHRQHKNRSVQQYTTRQKRAAWFDPSKAGKPAFPYTRELFGFLGAVRRARLSANERARCQLLMLRWAIVNSRSLAEDIVYAFRYLMRPLKRRMSGAESEERRV